MQHSGILGWAFADNVAQRIQCGSWINYWVFFSHPEFLYSPLCEIVMQNHNLIWAVAWVFIGHWVFISFLRMLWMSCISLIIRMIFICCAHVTGLRTFRTSPTTCAISSRAQIPQCQCQFQLIMLIWLPPELGRYVKVSKLFCSKEILQLATTPPDFPPIHKNHKSKMFYI